MKLNKTGLLFLVILIEGYVVLAAELIAIRQLIPFVGSGTENVAIIISAVLLPLAIGYNRGGLAFKRIYAKAKRSGKPAPSVRKLLLKNILSSLGIFALGLSYLFIEMLFGFMSGMGLDNRLLQTAIYSLLFVVTPVYLLGQTVPLVSNYFSRKHLSEITGRMLFFSTTGSFLGSVFSTIVLMMTIGVHNTVIVTLGLLALLAQMLNRKLLNVESLLCLVLMTGIYITNNNAIMDVMGVKSNNAYNIVTVGEVVNDGGRVLSVNRSSSSYLPRDPEKGFAYVRYIQTHLIDTLGMDEKAPRDVLIIGAGGFTMGLNDKVNRYRFVDIDPALKKVSEEHFLPEKLSPNKEFIVASARAFVHNDKQLYDLIVIDTYSNYISVPLETVTREFLLDCKKRLKPNGTLVANVVSSADFRERFSVRYHNTFASVFPVFTRQLVQPVNPYYEGNKVKSLANVLYIYFNREGLDDSAIYSDDKNTYSFDRH